MHQVHLGSHTYSLPSRWDELTRSQVIKAAYLSTQKLNSLSLAKLLFVVLSLSLPWHQRWRLMFFYFFQANTAERADLIYITRSFAEFTDFTAQKINKLRVKYVPKIQYYGPHSALANCTLWEYIKAEQYFTRYLQTNDVTFLNRLIAVIYRQPRPDFDPALHEDVRVPLIDSTIQDRALHISTLPLAHRTAILMWFDGCRSFIIKQFPLIFKKNDPSQEQEANKRFGPQPKSANWLDMITSLSANMTQFKEIANTNLSIALTDISFRVKQQNQAQVKKN